MLREIQRLNELLTVKYWPGWIWFALSSAGLVAQKPGEPMVKLPAAKILHAVEDEKSTKVWDRQVTWWTPWVPYNQDLERQARVAALESIRESALEMGILVDAQANARSSIRRLLEAVGIRQVSFSPAS